MNRRNLFFLLFIIDIIYTNGIARNDCNGVENKSIVLRLKKYLFCEYDPDVRPVQNNNNVTRVKFRMLPHFFDYNNYDNIFDLHTWVGMVWNDSHLTWDLAQYDNIQSIPVTNDEIWTPDISLHNSGRAEELSDYGQVKCWVSNQGLVQWFTAAKYSTYCVEDNTWWPYDTMNCTIQFGSWSHTSDEFELIPYQNNSSWTNTQSKNAEWDLLTVYMTKWENKYKFNSGSAKMLSYHFILRRHWGAIRIIHISPIIMLMMMTLMALWLEPKSLERMVIANFNFICHILCIQAIHWEASNGFNTPKLLIFYESSLALASFVLILTSILRHLQELTTEPPVWISAGTMSILRSRVGQILLVSILDPAATAKIETDADDNTDLVQSNSKRSPWRYVIVLVGWLAFLSVSLAYIVLLSAYLPMYYTVIS